MSEQLEQPSNILDIKKHPKFKMVRCNINIGKEETIGCSCRSDVFTVVIDGTGVGRLRCLNCYTEIKSLMVIADPVYRPDLQESKPEIH